MYANDIIFENPCGIVEFNWLKPNSNVSNIMSLCIFILNVGIYISYKSQYKNNLVTKN